MTLYTTFELTSSQRDADIGAAAAAESEATFDLAALDGPTFDLLAALFESDGATPDALGARVRVPREAVDGRLRTLGRLGYVEREGDAAWLTGEAFGLRQAMRLAGTRAPFRRNDA